MNGAELGREPGCDEGPCGWRNIVQKASEAEVVSQRHDLRMQDGCVAAESGEIVNTKKYALHNAPLQEWL